MFRRAFSTLFVASLICGSAGSILAAETEAVDLCALDRHAIVKDVVEMTKEEWAATHTDTTKQFEDLYAYYVPQLKSHCGAATSVISINSLLGETALTQDSLFNEDVAPIITQDVVYKQGFTLDELTRTVEARTDLHAKMFQIGTDGATLDDFRDALAADRTDDGTRIMINFSVQSLKGEGQLAGHFSPVWDYDAANDRILMLEVSAKRTHYSVDVDDMFSAMCAVDSVSGESRGWIVVSKDAGERKDDHAGM